MDSTTGHKIYNRHSICNRAKDGIYRSQEGIYTGHRMGQTCHSRGRSWLTNSVTLGAPLVPIRAGYLGAFLTLGQGP